MQLGSGHEIASCSNTNGLLTEDTRMKIDAIVGSKPIYILRQKYGEGFASGVRGDLTLHQVLGQMDRSSISLLSHTIDDWRI